MIKGKPKLLGVLKINLNCLAPPRVAIIREEGSNGDREMATAFMMAGFDAVDVTMTDLFETVDSLDHFNGLAFVGGFSYADVLGSAKGNPPPIMSPLF